MLVRKLYVVLVSAMLVSACASAPPKPPQLSADEQAQYANITPLQLLESAEKQLQQAHMAEFNLFAPGTLERMEQQLRELREYVKKPDADKNSLIALSKAVEQSAQAGASNKSLVMSQLSDVFAQKKVLDDIGAAKTYPGDYKDAMDDVLDLVKYIEAGKPDKARSDTPSVMQDMRHLEIRLIKETTLAKAKNTLATAKDKDADDNAKKSYEEATLAYARALKYIEGNPRDAKEIIRLGNEALFYANRAVWMAEEVARLQEIKPKDFELIVLEAEQNLQRISVALRGADVRDVNLREQSVALAYLAEKLLKASEGAQGSAEQLNQAKAELTAAVEKNTVLETKMAQMIADYQDKLATVEGENMSLRLKLQAFKAVETPVIEEPVKQPEPVVQDSPAADLPK